MLEIEAKRTRFSKTFDLGGGRRRLEIGQIPRHFERGGRLAEINLSHALDEARGQFVFRDCPHSLRIDKDVPAYAYNSPAGKRVSVELVTRARGCLAEGGLYKWAEVGANADYVIQPLPAGCATLLILHGPGSPREWSWRVAGDMSLIVPLVGKDSGGRRLELIETRDQESGTIAVRWTGRTIAPRELRRKQAAAWSDDVTWPAVIDPTVNENIAANGDDAHSIWYASGAAFLSFYSGDTLLSAGRVGSAFAYAGMRFQTIAVPAGATINSATLTIRVSGVTGTPNLNIFGNDTDDAAVWANPGNRIKNITKTTASVNKTSWSAGADNDITVTDLVAEIVARAGWASNNDMAFGFFNNAGSGTNFLTYAALEHATLTEARLAIDYTAAGAPPVRRVALIVRS